MLSEEVRSLIASIHDSYDGNPGEEQVAVISALTTYLDTLKDAPKDAPTENPTEAVGGDGSASGDGDESPAPTAPAPPAPPLRFMNDRT